MTAFSIEAAWEHLEIGAAEERACAAAIGIRAGDLWLTQADDAFVRRVRDQVILSAYKLAEWLAWNWWRLRWQSRSPSVDWALAHRMTTIGGGFVWPNLEIRPDGERIVLVARQTRRVPGEPLRYLTDAVVGLPATEWENAVDRFVDQVRGQLRAEGVADTNLDRIWSDVLAERSNTELALQRRFEALLGYDPDEAPEDLLNQCALDSLDLGADAVGELAASRRPAAAPVSAEALRGIAAAHGFDASPADAVRVALTLEPAANVPAWRRGVGVAQSLRQQAGLGWGPIDSTRLAELAGVDARALASAQSSGEFSFALDDSATRGRIALRSRWNTGRRFELARLLGDRLATQSPSRLLPATHAATYRQKLQRAFAAEFLCPVVALRDMLGADLSAEACSEAAAAFDVSELVVRTQLVNHGLLDRDALESDDANEGMSRAPRAA
ncbi:MAG: hypothetical protein ACOYOB_18695 [Myxococcota bacterium]